MLKSGFFNTGVFLWVLRFFKNSFFYRATPVVAFISTRKGRRGKRGQRSVGKFFKWKKKVKTFHLTSTCKFWCQLKQNIYVNLIELFALFFLVFLQIFFLVIPACSSFVFSFLTNWKIYLVVFVSIFSSRNWELLRKTAVRQNITKTVIFLTKLELVFYTVYYIRKSLNIFEVKSCAGILLGLWWKSPFGSFTEQLLWIFLHCCEWLLLIIYLINKCDRSKN